MSSRSISRVFEAARPLRNHDPVTFFQACRTRSATASVSRPAPQRTNRPFRRASQPQSRLFTSTPTRLATVVKHNPRTDEDGNTMSIIITDRAAKRLKQIVSTPPKKNSLTSTPSTAPESHLRVTVTAGGCHGFQYLMALEPADKIDREEDTIFEFEDEGQGRKAEVVMDGPSLELLKGSTVDFTTELIGSQFKIVGNPRASSSCGCGTSFDIE
ncbi:[4Fe-4S] proteins maturation [Knufia obscura]|uniref:[4Fe-4S] proteins maturation n=2 Tax=Knufia TaxID=430999 RepID=A0AAN8IPE5_9EURO|nr:[4Fe-4S] proteins maturation [Knufia obscura]KAK5955012.1 [4Fe-4S] proteins maturation [Knufia fluminis]